MTGVTGRGGAMRPEHRDASRGSALLRVGFAQDDLVRTRDLAADVAAEALHRERHVRAAHRTWGVVLGLRVALGASGSAVVVTPGFALDACGREILIGRPGTLRAPQRAEGTRVELVAEADACFPGLRWRDVGQPPGAGVVLARATATSGGALVDLDPGVRPSARPLVGGRVGSGTAELDLPVKPLAQVAVDTSAAGFATTPRYVVTLEEPPDTGYAALGDAWSRIGGPFLDVHDETPSGFELDVRLAFRSSPVDRLRPRDGPRRATSASRARATVRATWLGVEVPERCEPNEYTEEWR